MELPNRPFLTLELSKFLNVGVTALGIGILECVSVVWACVVPYEISEARDIPHLLQHRNHDLSNILASVRTFDPTQTY